MLYWPSCTIQGKRAITWATEVRIEKFKSLTSSSLMWLQFTRRTYFQIPFISYPKISSNVQIMRRIKNKEIFLVQIATRPFPKHIYRSLRALLDSTLTRNEFGSFQTQTIHKIEGSKPYIYSFYNKTRQIHTIVQKKSILFHTERNKFHTPIVYIPVILFLLFSSSSSLLFSLLFPFPFFMDHP